MSAEATAGARGHEKSCYWHSEYKIIVHCFPPGQCRCVCGEIVVRKQIRRVKIGNFGRGQFTNFSS